MSPTTLVRSFRKRLGLSQSHLASELGVTLRQVQRWEAGDTPPPYLWRVLEHLEAELERRAA